LQDAPAEQHWPLVYSLVTDATCKVLRIADTARVSGNSRLTELGLDSLMASELARTPSQRTGVSVSPLPLLRGLSVAELSGYILKQV
jgi:acyl carrier protein